MRVDAPGLERGEPDAHLAEEHVLDGVAGHEAALVADLAVVEDGDGEHGAVVVHVPVALLVEPRREAVDDGLRAEPLDAVLGDTLGVARAAAIACAHGAQAERVVDAKLDGRLRRWIRGGGLEAGGPAATARVTKMAAHLLLLLEIKFLQEAHLVTLLELLL